MGTMWETATPLLDTDLTGFFGDLDCDEPSIYYVRWNRSATRRYAEEAVPGLVRDRDGSEHRRVALHYEKGALARLTTSDRLPVAAVLKTFAGEGPWDRCMFCNYRISNDMERALGVTVGCAKKHLGVGPKLLRAVWRGVPPTGPGTPVPVDGRPRLYLATVDGRRVA